MNSSSTTISKISKKEARQLVYNKLTDALVDFKAMLKKKKFENKLIKATKLFADDIAKSSEKNKAKIKKATTKKAAKKVVEAVS